jgi:hypothetical protein
VKKKWEWERGQIFIIYIEQNFVAEERNLAMAKSGNALIGTWFTDHKAEI